ncbi:MAG: polyprenyl synthetase family protein [Streptococcaceae bacterium]|nr:polyprenyl synthetase family protein [Streptococcaceae bacterium]
MDIKDTIWEDYPNLNSQLNQVKAMMKSHINLKSGNIKSAILDLFNAGGKMLRPAYLLLFSDFTDLSEKEKIALAAAVEIFHTATLIHDDVIDKAETRRNLPTVSHQYGVETAVYGGDYLFVVAFRLLSEYSLELSNLSKNLTSFERLLGGELGQFDKSFNTEQTIENYIENISGKTGELFALSTSIAPLIDKNKILANTTYKIGMNIGISFQIMDDYLDYTSDTDQLGKPVLEDIKQGIYSAPVLYALKLEPERVKSLLKEEKFDEIYAFIQSSQALTLTKELANSYTKKALNLMKKLPDGQNKINIEKITKKLLERTL